MTAGPFNVSYVPKQANGLLQSRKPVWKGTSRKRPERIYVGPRFELPQASRRMKFHLVVVDEDDSRRPSSVVCGVLG